MLLAGHHRPAQGDHIHNTGILYTVLGQLTAAKIKYQAPDREESLKPADYVQCRAEKNSMYYKDKGWLDRCSQVLPVATVASSVAEPAEPEPPEPYHFDPRRTGTISLL
jgi:hypothetical protein